VDLGRAPQRVLKTHSSDQVAHLSGDPRSATRRAGFPSPVAGRAGARRLAGTDSPANSLTLIEIGEAISARIGTLARVLSGAPCLASHQFRTIQVCPNNLGLPKDLPSVPWQAERAAS